MSFGGGKHVQSPPLLVARPGVSPELEVTQHMLRVATKCGESKERPQ